MNGEIVWYSPAKRYGFVAPAEGGGDIVFHLTPEQARALECLESGTPVHFLLDQTERGPIATHLGHGALPGT